MVAVHGHRHDAQLVKDMVRRFGPGAAEYLQSIPLVYIGPTQLEELTRLVSQEYAKRGEDALVEADRLSEELREKGGGAWINNVLPKRAVYRVNNMYFVFDRETHGGYYDCFLYDAENTQSYAYTGSFAARPSVARASFSNVNPELDDTSFNEKFAGYFWNAELCGPMSTAPEGRIYDALTEMIDQQCEKATSFIGILILFLNTTDYMPVETKTHKPVHKKIHEARPWLKEDLLSVVFLNRLPTISAPKGDYKGGHHRSPVRHRRQQHTKTLTHPRYKNHPKYMQPDAIKVGETWVGETETVVNNIEYRVRLPA